MTTKTLTFLFLVMHTLAMAQWSNDPANPQVVCNEANFQNNQQSYPDGEGGAYILWLDTRTDIYKNEVYGQHVNGDGVALWEPEGRLILTDSKSIDFFRFYRYSDGKMIIGWYPNAPGIASVEDKLFFQELNDQGGKIWAEDLVISHEDPNGSLSVGTFSNAIVKRDALGFQVCMMIQTYGYDRIRMSRFSEDGTLMMPLNGIEIGPLDIGNVSMTGDEGNGAYVYYSSGNGAGASLMCMHVDAYGIGSWENWVSVADANGLSYQFSAIGDASGVTFVWQGSGVNAENIYARRLNLDGSFDWNGESANICLAEGSQTSFSWLKTGSDYYIVWADGRPGVVGYYAVFAQKFNQSGEVLWAQDGIEIANLNTYSPTPRIVAGTEGLFFITHLSTTAGYVIQQINSNGEVLWDSEGEQIATTNYLPNGNDRREIVSSDNLLAVWVAPVSSGGSDIVYINRVLDLTPVTIIEETASACETYTYEDMVFSESGVYDIIIGQDSILHLNLTIHETAYETLEAAVCDGLLLNGVLYEESGTYTQVVPNIFGCDSIITLILEITAPDTGIVLNGTTLTAVQENATYFWIDCETGEFLNAFEQSFTPTESGSYRVQIISSGCQESSDCVSVTIIGVDDHESNKVEVYPNPFQDRITLNGPGNLIEHVQISDQTGRLLINLANVAPNTMLDLSTLDSGIYTIQVKSSGVAHTRRILKL